MIDITIATADFDVNTELEKLRGKGSIGAVVSFVGLVRDMESTLTTMHLECYEQMAQKALTDIANQAQKRWRVEDIVIYHRIGTLGANEQIVLVITTSKHREDAFNACYFVMDYLKTEAPFWKKETTTEDEHWVEAHSKDMKARDKWS